MTDAGNQAAVCWSSCHGKQLQLVGLHLEMQEFLQARFCNLLANSRLPNSGDLSHGVKLSQPHDPNLSVGALKVQVGEKSRALSFACSDGVMLSS